MKKHKSHTSTRRTYVSGIVGRLGIITMFAVAGFATFQLVRAATYAVSSEAEAGTLAGSASMASDSTASAGSSVKFGASAPTGTIYWQDAPDSAVGAAYPYKNWQATSWNIVSGTDTIIADAQKGKAHSFNMTSGSGSTQRVEGVTTYDPVYPGKTLYVGFDLKLSAGAANASSIWQCIMQLKSSSEGNPSFELDVDSGKLFAMANRQNQPNAKYLMGTAPIEKWSRIVLKMYITHGTDSKLAVWQDGKQTLQDTSWVSHDNTDNVGSGGLIYSDSPTGYFKFGLYRGAGNNFPMNVRYANMKIGSTYDIVAQ